MMAKSKAVRGAGGTMVEAMECRRFLSASGGGAGLVIAPPVLPPIGVPTLNHGTGVKFIAYQGVAYHGTVGSFKAFLPPQGLVLRATIDWGDGKESIGRLNFDAGRFDVIGTHTYAKSGKYTLHIFVTGSPRQIPGQPTPEFIAILADFKSAAVVKLVKPV